MNCGSNGSAALQADARKHNSPSTAHPMREAGDAAQTDDGDVLGNKITCPEDSVD
jgi:hypothetical protein